MLATEAKTEKAKRGNIGSGSGEAL